VTWPESCLLLTGEVEFGWYSGQVYDHTELCFCFFGYRRPAERFGFWAGRNVRLARNAGAIGESPNASWHPNKRWAAIFTFDQARFARISIAVSASCNTSASPCGSIDGSCRFTRAVGCTARVGNSTCASYFRPSQAPEPAGKLCRLGF